MHARIASASFFFFALFSSAHFTAAQSSPIPSQAPQSTEKMLPAANLLPPPSAAQIVLLPNQNGSANDHAIELQGLKTWMERLQNQKDGLAKDVQRFGSGPDAPNCARIRIFRAPEMDSEMVVQMSHGDGGPIQTIQGLPPCRRDLPAPMTVQRFSGLPPMLPFQPRRPFVQPPASQIPSAQPQQVRPKTDAPDQKPGEPAGSAAQCGRRKARFLPSGSSSANQSS